MNETTLLKIAEYLKEQDLNPVEDRYIRQNFEDSFSHDVEIFNDRRFSLKYLKSAKKLYLATEFSNQEINDDYVKTIIILKGIVDEVK